MTSYWVVAAELVHAAHMASCLLETVVVEQLNDGHLSSVRSVVVTTVEPDHGVTFEHS